MVTVGPTLSHPAWKGLAAQPSRLARQQTSQTPDPGNHCANWRRKLLSPDNILESQKSSIKLIEKAVFYDAKSRNEEILE